LITTRSSQVAANLDIPRNNMHGLMKLEGDDAVAMLRAYVGDIDEAFLLPFAESLGGHALALTIAIRRIKTPNLEFKIRQATKIYATGIPAGKSFRDLKLIKPKEIVTIFEKRSKV